MRLGEWLPCSPRGGPCRSGRTLLVHSLTDQDEKRLLPDENIPGLTEKRCGRTAVFRGNAVLNSPMMTTAAGVVLFNRSPSKRTDWAITRPPVP